MVFPIRRAGLAKCFANDGCSHAEPVSASRGLASISVHPLAKSHDARLLKQPDRLCTIIG